MSNILQILELINAAIALGGDFAVLGLKAYNALKDMSGLDDAQLSQKSEELNDEDRKKLNDLVTSIQEKLAENADTLS